MDSFLPSGAVASPPLYPPSAFTSADRGRAALNIPRSIPGVHEFNHQQHVPHTFNRENRPQLPRSKSSQNRNNRPISPPKTRSTSAEDSAASLIEDWRAYTSKLRSQTDGERAHMMADRARAEEIMDEERALWEEERQMYKDTIADLNREIVEMNKEIRRLRSGANYVSPPAASRASSYGQVQNGPFSIASAGSSAMSVPGSSDGNTPVQQESGRNADGTPFYAPTTRYTSRTFENPQVAALRVDTMSAPGESPIQVTSRELTPSDFGPQNHSQSGDHMETIPETESAPAIDISLIQPGLDGIAIKPSAVAPSFVAKVLSPQTNSPAKMSPNIRTPGRPVETLSRQTSVGHERGENRTVLEVMAAPENTRLTMHAGHTPNHSLGHVDLSGIHSPVESKKPHVHKPSCLNYDGTNEPDTDNMDNGDAELTGQLGLTNNPEKDDFFLNELVEKLEDVKRQSEANTPTSESGRRSPAKEDDLDDVKGLKLKPSMNFGAPMGRF